MTLTDIAFFVVILIGLLVSFFVLGVGLYLLFKLTKPVIKKALTYLPKGYDFRKPLSPVLQKSSRPWESNAVFNPAALYIDGYVHLLYRALGVDGFSRIGYARSKNGTTFDTRLPYPVYVPRELEEGLEIRPPITNWKHSHSLYPSGGGWGGCEDPRAVVIEDTVYMTYNAINGWGSMRVALTSISKSDFLNHTWTWRRPVFISPGTRHKNWVLFPEKIHGKFAILHSILCDSHTEVRIVFVDDPYARETGQYIFESPDPQQFSHRPCAWHERVRSAGPPPMKTDRGWLLLYHATDARESHKYKLGAMVLDLNDPTKILARAHHPILEPTMWYENEGKPGIVYACGAIIKDGILHVYYGGADTVASVATIELSSFLDALFQGEASLSKHSSVMVTS